MAMPARPAVVSHPELVGVEWVTHEWFRVLGYYFSLATNGRELAEYVDTVIGAFATARDLAEEPNPPTPGVPPHYELVDLASNASGPRYRLYCNGVIMSGSEHASHVFDHFFWHVNAEAARRTGDYVLIHAGAVGAPRGQGVVLPGGSGSGKSTLVAGLVRAGYTYYSDEAAAIDPIGRLLYCYPKAITLKDETVFKTFPDLPSAQTRSEYVRNRWYIVPAHIRPDVVGSPTPVRYVISSEFAVGEPTRITRVSKATAALALGRSVLNIGRYGGRVLPLLAGLVEGAECFALRSGDLVAAVEAIADVTND